MMVRSDGSLSLKETVKLDIRLIRSTCWFDWIAILGRLFSYNNHVIMNQRRNLSGGEWLINV